jgi:radical SAM superfamily enzyme YgiQ (UPF0313 family)
VPRPGVLLVNPPIHDFAAYDFWARPLGLLTLGGALRASGVAVTLLDALDPGSPWLTAKERPRRRQPGRGRFHRAPLHQVPGPIAELGRRIGRRFARYGLGPDSLVRALESARPPDAVLLGCGMTYWYPGALETAALVRRTWPRAPLLLGGVYATLCPAHAAACSGVDRVVPGGLDEALAAVGDTLGVKLERDPDALPAHDLAAGVDAAALATSSGCPRRCAYCGVAALAPRYRARAPEHVEREARAIAALGIRDLALYDDALLARPERAVAILERLAPLALRLHAASGLSCRGLTREVARAMRRGGLCTVRLGLETADPDTQRRLGDKASLEDLAAALRHLEQAGYERRDVGVYVMAGLPRQGLAEIEDSLERVASLGARPHLAEYSPVPGSPLFDEACAASPLPLAEEPLHHNPTLLPCASFGHGDLARIKVHSKELWRRVAKT